MSSHENLWLISHIILVLCYSRTMISTLCKCGNPRASGGRYCLPCKAAYNREWRKTHPLNDEQKRKSNCRRYTNVYIERGKLLRQPCVVCGSEQVEPHHHDYDKPLDVTWLCREHHLEHHASLDSRKSKAS